MSRFFQIGIDLRSLPTGSITLKILGRTALVLLVTTTKTRILSCGCVRQRYLPSASSTGSWIVTETRLEKVYLLASTPLTSIMVRSDTLPS